jgi:hypothetical protein
MLSRQGGHYVGALCSKPRLNRTFWCQSALNIDPPSASKIDFLVLLKTETTGHLEILDRLLTAAGKDTRLIGLIESTRGLAAVEAIAAATPRLAGLILGAADMAADLGAPTAWAPLAFARGRLITACALVGVISIDAPFFDLRGEAGLKHEIAAASCRYKLPAPRHLCLATWWRRIAREHVLRKTQVELVSATRAANSGR